MSSKTFISTSRGFIKSIEKTYTDGEIKVNFKYTNKLMYAQQYTGKQAIKVLERFNIDGFIYKPFEETNIKGYILVGNITFDEYFHGTNKDYKGFTFKKDSIQVSDQKFLQNNCEINPNKEWFYESEIAKEHANRLNKQIIKNLKNTILNNKKEF